MRRSQPWLNSTRLAKVFDTESRFKIQTSHLISQITRFAKIKMLVTIWNAFRFAVELFIDEKSHFKKKNRHGTSTKARTIECWQRIELSSSHAVTMRNVTSFNSNLSHPSSRNRPTLHRTSAVLLQSQHRKRHRSYQLPQFARLSLFCRRSSPSWLC